MPFIKKFTMESHVTDLSTESSLTPLFFFLQLTFPKSMQFFWKLKVWYTEKSLQFHVHSEKD